MFKMVPIFVAQIKYIFLLSQWPMDALNTNTRERVKRVKRHNRSEVLTKNYYFFKLNV